LLTFVEQGLQISNDILEVPRFSHEIDARLVQRPAVMVS